LNRDELGISAYIIHGDGMQPKENIINCGCLKYITGGLIQAVAKGRNNWQAIMQTL
jgi:hypothetical protein